VAAAAGPGAAGERYSARRRRRQIGSVLANLADRMRHVTSIRAVGAEFGFSAQLVEATQEVQQAARAEADLKADDQAPASKLEGRPGRPT
jgi:hypothetical protein